MDEKQAERWIDRAVEAAAWMCAVSACALAVGILTTGCGSTGMSVSLVDVDVLPIGGREQTTMARGDADGLMEAGGSTVPVTDSLNPDLPIYLTQRPGAGTGTISSDRSHNTPAPGPAVPATGGGDATTQPDEGASQDATGEAVTDGVDVFLWKPVSENTGDLVVLLPASLTGAMAEGGVVTAGETVLRYASVANGGRTHWRADEPGASWGADVTVTAVAADGQSWSWTVPNGADRYEEAL